MQGIRFIFFVFLFLSFNKLIAQDRTEVWTRLSVYSEKLIPKTRVTFEGQYRIQYQTRFTNSILNTYTFRIWILGKLGNTQFFYQSSPFALFYRKAIDGAKDFESTELRLTQFLGYRCKVLPLEFRSGIELRNFHQEKSVVQEWRSRTRVQALFRQKKEIQPLFSAEYFYRFSTSDNQMDQLRPIGALRGIFEKIEVELGYQYHIRNPKDSRVCAQVINLNLIPKI